MSKRRRRFRWFLLSLVVMVGALVALLPTLLSLGPARRLVVAAAQDHVAGTASVDSVRLRWFGRQAVNGFVIEDATGRRTVQLDLGLDRGLFSVLTRSSKPIEATIGGSLVGTLDDHGRVQLAALPVKSADRRSSSEADADTTPPAPIRISGLPPIGVLVNMLRLELDLVSLSDTGGDQAIDRQSIIFDGITGEARYRPGGQSTIGLTSSTTSGTQAGTFNVTASANSMFDADGLLTPAGASIDATLTLESLPVPFVPDGATLQSGTIRIVTDDLAQNVSVTLKASTAFAAAKASLLDGNLTINAPFGADGTPAFDLTAVTGRITGSDVPAELLQTLLGPALARTGILLSRDMGPTINLSAVIADSPAHDLEVHLDAERFDISAAGAIDLDTRRLTGDRLDFDASVHPELIAAFMGEALPIDQSALIETGVQLSSFTLPFAGDGWSPDIARLGVQGDVEISTRLVAPGDVASPTAVEPLHVALEVETGRLDEGLSVVGSIELGAGILSIDERISDLVNEQGTFSIMRATPVGTIEATSMPAAMLVDALVRHDESLLPHEQVLAAALGPTLSFQLHTSEVNGDLQARFEATGAQGVVKAVAERGPTALHIAKLRADLSVTPALIAAIQAQRDDPITLVADAEVTLSVDPLTLPGTIDGGFAIGEEPIVVHVVAPQILADNLPRLNEAVALRDVGAQLRVNRLDPLTVHATGGALVHRTSADRTITEVRLDLEAEQVEKTWRPNGTVVLSGLRLRHYEDLLDRPRGTVSDWVGPRGTASIGIESEEDGTTLTVEPQLTNLQGKFVVRRVGDMLTMTEGRATLNASAEALQRVLEPESKSARAEATGSGLTVEADVPMTLQVNSCRVPLGMLSGEPIAPDAVVLDADLTGGPLVMLNAVGERIAMDSLALTLRGSNLDEGFEVIVTGRPAAGSETGQGTIDALAVVANLRDDGSNFSLRNATTRMTADAEDVPTAVADALARFNGMLIAAVGPLMSSTARAEDFSPTSGSMEFDIRTTNGSLTGQLFGGDDALIIQPDHPIEGSLTITSAMREQLLARIHPVLRDIRGTDQLMTAEIFEARVPVNGDPAGLNARLQIKIGDVEFNRDSGIFGLLARFADSSNPTVPAYIEPIQVRIANGILAYDLFAIEIDKYTMRYEGTVDLINRTVDLRTHVPLTGLSGTFKELRGYADDIVVPLVTRGSLDKPKTEIDPEFDMAGAAAQAGFRGVLGEVLKDKDGTEGGEKMIRDILGDLLGGKRKDTDKK